jgi:hypothetical protein
MDDFFVTTTQQDQGYRMKNAGEGWLIKRIGHGKALSSSHNPTFDDNGYLKQFL